MDISGTQLNSAAIAAYNTQLQASSKQDRQVEAPAASKPLAPEVSLSSEAKDRATQEGQPVVAQATNAPSIPAAQTNTSTFAERQAVQSYFSVSNF
jgi:hypothetical protein